MEKKKIVTIGGGTGQFTLLKGLKKIRDIIITAVASMVDSGGSTGRLRKEGVIVLPPSDIFRCILALSPYSENKETLSLLLHRIGVEGKLKGHTVPNMLMSSFAGYSDFSEAVMVVSDWLRIAPNEAFPVTLSNANLAGITESGRIISGEATVGTRDDPEPFKSLFLVPEAEAFPSVLERISQADLIVMGPGDLITSLIPNLLVKGIPEAIALSRAKKIYVLNIMTRYAETHGFKASDHVLYLEDYMHAKFNFIICNSVLPAREILSEYEKERAYPVELDIDGSWDGRQVIKAMILGGGEMARHDPERLAMIIGSLS